jgi:hypothetical protein
MAFSHTRREFLRVIAASSAAATVLPAACRHSVPPPMAASFFTADERKALAALADFILPPDAEPGAASLGAVEYIERLMLALEGTSPEIFAGGPYSGREPFPNPDGTPSERFPSNDFTDFLAPDRVSEAAWRLRLYGSSGVPQGGPNDAIVGPTTGLRDSIKSGLADALSAAPGPIDKLTPDQMKALYVGLSASFKSDLLPLIMEAAFSAPEYGGNKDLGGWKIAHFDGDSAPLGFTQYDPTTGMYRERPDAPYSSANPGVDADPLGAESTRVIMAVITGLDGRMFS